MTLKELKQQAQDHIIRSPQMMQVVMERFSELDDEELYDQWLRDTHAPLGEIVEEMKKSPVCRQAEHYTLKEIVDYTDIIFLSLKGDAVRLYEMDSVDKIMKYFWDKGVKIVVIKSHIDNGYQTGYKGEISFTEFYNTTKAIDTTASGDVFNGGFIYAITNGYSPSDATKFASVTSGLQTQNYGAIQSIPYLKAVMENVQQ